MEACRCQLLAATVGGSNVALVVEIVEESECGSPCDFRVEVGGSGHEAISIQSEASGSRRSLTLTMGVRPLNRCRGFGVLLPSPLSV